jgi:hypothetical protein
MTDSDGFFYKWTFLDVLFEQYGNIHHIRHSLVFVLTKNAFPDMVFNHYTSSCDPSWNRH